MFRIPVVMVTMGAVTLAGIVPHEQAAAQSGQSLVFAERACLDYGVPPNTPVFESCVGRAARAFDRGEPDLAYLQARATRNARDTCRADGIAPGTSGYSQCVNQQVDQRIER
jgi:hypothetical protein